MSAIIGSIPSLFPGQTYKLLHNFVGAVTGTPTWALLVDGVQVGQGDGAQVSGSQWSFDVAVPGGATVGKSAQVSIKATVDAAAVEIEYNSIIIGTVNLLETGMEYNWDQQSEDLVNKTANVIITKV